jgi:hypothetical protein
MGYCCRLFCKVPFGNAFWFFFAIVVIISEGDDRKYEHDISRGCDLRDFLEHQFWKTESIAA